MTEGRPPPQIPNFPRQPPTETIDPRTEENIDSKEPKRPPPKWKVQTVRLTQEIDAGLTEEADRLGLNKTSLVRLLITRGIATLKAKGWTDL